MCSLSSLKAYDSCQKGHKFHLCILELSTPASAAWAGWVWQGCRLPLGWSRDISHLENLGNLACQIVHFREYLHELWVQRPSTDKNLKKMIYTFVTIRSAVEQSFSFGLAQFWWLWSLFLVTVKYCITSNFAHFKCHNNSYSVETPVAPTNDYYTDRPLAESIM